MHLLLLAKRPEPGRAKTRLIPWLGADGAAELAAAAIADTIDAARASVARRIVVAFDGDPSGVLPADVEVIPQCDGDLAERLAAAWDAFAGPGIQIGMDTPHLGPHDLDRAFSALARPRTDAVLGPAKDGGWWAIGLHRPVPGLFTGIPTSQADTGERQRDRLDDLGLATTLLATHTDLDEPTDAPVVAAAAPHTRVAALVRSFVISHGPPPDRSTPLVAAR